MISDESLEKIRILEHRYKEAWGKEVDYTNIPKGMTQEKLVNTLERMITTNESITVAFNKV